VRTKKRLSSVASGTRNSASGTRKHSSKTSTPADQFSSELPSSQVSRSRSTSRAAGRKEVNKSVNSSGHSSSAVSAGLSKNAERVSHSTQSKAGFSAAHADSGTRESTSVAGASRKETSGTGVGSSKSNSHSPKNRNSASNALSSDVAERDKHSAKSQPQVSAAMTTRSTRTSSITVPSDKSSTPNNEETAGGGMGSLHHKATAESGSLSTRSRKTNSANKKVADSATDNARDVQLDGDVVPARGVVHSSHLLPVEETSFGSTAATGGNPVVNGFSSSIDTSRHSVAPTSSEAVAHQQASSVADSVTSTAGMNVMTSGKTIVTNHSNVASARTRSAAQSRQTSFRTQTASSSKAVGSSAVSNAASMDVVASGKSTVASRSTVSGSTAQSVTGGGQISAADVAASVATAMR